MEREEIGDPKERKGPIPGKWPEEWAARTDEEGEAEEKGWLFVPKFSMQVQDHGDMVNDSLIFGSLCSSVSLLMIIVGQLFVDGTVNKPGPSCAGEIREEPLSEDNESISEADKVKNMDEAPAEPGDET